MEVERRERKSRRKGMGRKEAKRREEKVVEEG